MTVCSGPSGSGKSSLAIDTLYAEGQRRYVESLRATPGSSWLRSRSPRSSGSRACRRRSASSRRRPARARARRWERSLRSTITCGSCLPGSGIRIAPKCGVPIGTQTADEIVEKILHLPEGTKVFVMAPVERRDGEQYETLWDDLRASGLRAGPGRRPVGQPGRSAQVEPPPQAQDRGRRRPGVVRRSTRSRLADSIESALDLGKGVVHVARVGDECQEPSWPSSGSASIASCERCGRSFEELRRIISRSTARWAGARSARGSAPSTARTRRCSCPTAEEPRAKGAVAVWPEFGANPSSPG